MKNLFLAKILAAVLTLALCLLSSPVAYAAGSPSIPDPKNIAAEDLLMRDYIRIYENALLGAQFEPGKADPEAAVAFSFAFLRETGGLAPYAVYQDSRTILHYSIPAAEIDELCSLFFGCHAPESGSDEGFLFPSETPASPPSPELSLLACEMDPAGRLSLTIERTMDSRAWRTARYVFAPSAAPVPAVLAGIIPAGRQLYRFVSVENLPLPAAHGREIPISTPRELAKLADLVNSGDSAYAANTYRLTADLDLGGISIDPIGCYLPTDPRDPAPAGFSAVFDGGGHTIRNLSMVVSGSPAGLFSCVGRDGRVTGLSLWGGLVRLETESGDDCAPAGGLAGACYGVIEDCSFSGQVQGGKETGGLIGKLVGGTVRGCRADVQVSGTASTGGLIGRTLDAGVYTCTATGNVTADAEDNQLPIDIGGFIGHNENTYISRGIVSVRVTAPAKYRRIGCVAGYNYGAFTDSFYNADLAAGGAPIGYAYTGADYTVDLTGLPSAQLTEMGVLGS
ncbi:hypothetical protein [Anaerotruncus rubiinfantis]|uniref:hypothetical protein n=1 Tax=Anaerotruncus rubiinfantis TaxID=1720200 RepID=UPI0034A58C53